MKSGHGVRRRFTVRNSQIHGRGVFAALALKAGELLCEYEGERIRWDEAACRPPHDPNQPDHTFFFQIGDGFVIDGAVGGNSARWINHSCEPNCEPELDGQRVFIRAIRRIRAGEELSIDYALVGVGRVSRQLRERYACYCGASQCRGTMLAGKTSR